MRRSCEVEWARLHPPFAVSQWIGHSITVSGKHEESSVPGDLFNKVAGIEKEPAKIPVRKASGTPRNAPKQEMVHQESAAKSGAENTQKRRRKQAQNTNRGNADARNRTGNLGLMNPSL